MNATITPRLIDEDATAALLGFSRAWLHRHRDRLYARGFPQPVLDTDEFGSRRYDRKAIETWIDGHTNHRHITPDAGNLVTDWEKTLSDRAATITI